VYIIITRVNLNNRSTKRQ